MSYIMVGYQDQIEIEEDDERKGEVVIFHGHAGSSRRLKSATYLLPLFLVTFLPSSVSSRMTATHSSASCSASETRSKDGWASKCSTIQL